MGFHPLDIERAVVRLGFGLLVLGREHRHRRDILQAVVHETRQLLHALHGGSGDGHEGQALIFHILAEGVDLLLGGQIALVAHHDLRALGQHGAELCQLFVDLFKVLDGVAALAAGNVHHMQQQAAALHMAQEVVAQTDALAGTLDQAGDVGADKAGTLCHRHNAQRGHQCGKVVVCDLGFCRADGGDEGGLAHIGEADQTHVRDQFQLQRHLNVLAGHTGLCKLGDLAGRRCKVRVAVAASAALCNGDRVMIRQVCNDKAALGVLDDGAQRHLDDQIFGVLAVAQACTALAAFRGNVLALVAEIHQGGQVIVHHKNNVAAAAAIAAVRAASGHEFFTVKAHRTVAALARVEPYRGDVDKVGLCCHTAPPYIHQKEPGQNGPALRLQLFRKKLLLDAALLAVFTHALETDGTVHQSKQGVIAALANVLTRHDVGATLTNQDVAGQNELTVCTLGAQTLCCGIAAVLGAAYALFMCHCNLPP